MVAKLRKIDSFSVHQFRTLGKLLKLHKIISESVVPPLEILQKVRYIICLYFEVGSLKPFLWWSNLFALHVSESLVKCLGKTDRQTNN